MDLVVSEKAEGLVSKENHFPVRPIAIELKSVMDPDPCQCLLVDDCLRMIAGIYLNPLWLSNSRYSFRGAAECLIIDILRKKTVPSIIKNNIRSPCVVTFPQV